VPADDPLALLRRESRSLVQRLRLWTPARWAAAAPPYGTRADLAHHLAQSLADLAAQAEGEVRRAVPRLDTDLGLPDQLAVTADDLGRAGPAPAVAVAATAHLLAHRQDLLDEDVPAGLAAALGLADVVGAGREQCQAPHRPS
jgi:beta-phosphoglucomutase-like phosphatase (HAD superfamily)